MYSTLFRIFAAFVGTVKTIKKTNLHVVVEKMLYQSVLKVKQVLKISMSNSGNPLTKSQTCCKRITPKSAYIFAGSYKITKKGVKYIINGCRTIYSLSLGMNEVLNVNNIDHRFLEQCQFRVLASNG